MVGVLTTWQTAIITIQYSINFVMRTLVQNNLQYVASAFFMPNLANQELDLNLNDRVQACISPSVIIF